MGEIIISPRNDEGPFPNSVFSTSVFARRIFPWMGGEDDDDEQEDYSKSEQLPETENEDDK